MDDHLESVIASVRQWWGEEAAARLRAAPPLPAAAAAAAAARPPLPAAPNNEDDVDEDDDMDVEHPNEIRHVGTDAAIVPRGRESQWYQDLLESGQADQMPKFKLLLVGDGGVGADELLRLHQNCMVDITYDATLNVFNYALVFFTSRGPIMIKVCDTVGQEAFGGLRDAYYAGGQCAIIMFHRSSRITYKNVPNWHRDLTRVCHSTVPIVLAGNMNGNEEPTVKDGSVIKNARIKNMQYYNLDTSSNPPVNVEKPFLWIARKLSGDDHLMFVVSPYEPPHGPENPQDP